MPSLREVRNRINSIRSTKQITGAMKMVAASKLHRAQATINHLRYYEQCLGSALMEVNKQIPNARKHPYLLDKGNRSVLIIAIGSNKGLCGTYNSLIIKRTIARIKFLESQQIDYKLLVIGKRIELFLRKRNYHILDTDHELIEKLSHRRAQDLASKISGLFLSDETDRVEVIGCRFRNAAVQEICIEQLLPLSFEDITETSTAEVMPFAGHSGEYDPADQSVPEEFGYILEPGKERVLNALVENYFVYHLFRLITDAYASEQGARMTSMHKATDNADQLIKELTLTYNKVRQAIITRELMEIVGGAAK